MCVSHEIAFIGEQSPSGNLYAIDIAGGDILWKFAAANVVVAELQNVPIQVLSIFVLIKMIMFMRTLTDLLQPKTTAAIMVKLLLLIKMVISLAISSKNENIDSWIN